MPVGTITAAAFCNRVLRRLNEYATSPAGNLESGTGGAPTIATADTIADYASEAVACLCRTCWPVRASFTLTPGATVRMIAYSDLSLGADAPSGSIPWQAISGSVLWAPSGGTTVPLDNCTESALGLAYPGYLMIAPGYSVSVWYPVGGEGFGVGPAPLGSGAGVLTAYCLLVLPPAAGSGAMFPLLPDDLLTSVIEPYAAGMIASKGSENPVMGPKAGLWLSMWEEGRAQLYSRVDPLLRAYFPPLVPTVPGATPAADSEGGS